MPDFAKDFGSGLDLIHARTTDPGSYGEKEKALLAQVPGSTHVYPFEGEGKTWHEPTRGTVWEKAEIWKDGSQHFRKLKIEGGAVYAKKYGDSGLIRIVRMMDAAKGHRKQDTDSPMDDEKRLDCNVSRARSMIEEYGLCNDFQWFSTFTISPEKLDRSDLEKFRKRLTQLVRDTRRRKDIDVQFLLVPELHRDGKSWHIHGLLSVSDPSLFEEYRYSPKLPKRLKDRLKAGKRVFRWKSAEDNYGWNTIEPIEDKERAVRYIMKYLKKDGQRTAEALEKGQHLYYASRGLKKAEKINPEVLAELPDPCFEKHYETCTVAWYKM